MATSKSAEKRVRQNKKRRRRNNSWKSKFKNARGKFRDAIERGDNTDHIEELANDALSLADKLSTKGVIHQNKAARWKSRIHKRLNEYSG